MKFDAHLDVDVLAHESDDQLSVLLELTAPELPTTSERTPSALQIVLDRSGSMAGERLEGAKKALLAIIDRLDPRDSFGLVAFDDQARVVVAAGPLTDKALVKHAIARIDAGGSTDLAAGYLLGLQEARRVGSSSGATLLLVSDGHANAGETSPEILGEIAAAAHAKHNVSTSTLGYGLGFETASALIGSASSYAPPSMVGDFNDEAETLRDLVRETTYGESARAAKMTSADAAFNHGVADATLTPVG